MKPWINYKSREVNDRECIVQLEECVLTNGEFTLNGHKILHVNNPRDDYQTILTGLAAGYNLIDLTIVRTL